MTFRVISKALASELGRASVVFEVEQDGDKLGTLAVSKGALEWFPRSASLGCKIEWASFDRLMQDHAGHGARSTDSRAREPRRRRTAGVLAPYFDSPCELRASYRGQPYRARVTADGRIAYDDSIYDSPSSAASAILQAGRRNGWKFWRFRNSEGDWVPLDALRQH